jgi:hypothetical protein
VLWRSQKHIQWNFWFIYIYIYTLQGLNFPNRISSKDANRTWTLVSTRRSLILSSRSQDVNRFSKQSTIALISSLRRYVSPKGPWTAVGAFLPSLSVSYFAIACKTWGMNSQFPTLFPLLYQCPSRESFLWCFVRPNYLTFYMLGPELLATVSLIYAYVSTDLPDKVDP